MIEKDIVNDRYISTALLRGFEVLKLFNQNKSKLTLAEISRELGLKRTVPYRLVYTLEKLGYLSQDKVTKQYRLTPRVMELGFNYLNSLQIPEIAQPFLDDLRDLTGFSVHLGILDGNELVYVARAGTKDSRPVIDVKIGAQMPAHATAIGKTILAYQDETFINDILLSANLEAYTEHTKTSLDKLRLELETIKLQGYSLSNEEFEMGITSIAVPIFMKNNEVLVALSIAAPIVNLKNGNLIKKILPQLQLTASEISIYYGNMES